MTDTSTRRLVAASLLALVTVSCTVSRVSSKADVRIAGTVQRIGGLPVAGARLALTREGDAGDVLITLSSLGVACLAGKQAPAICHNARLTSAGGDGNFEYSLKGKDTQSTFGYSAVLSISTALPAKENETGGSSTTYRFHVQTQRLSLPIRLWEPVLAARTGAFGARATFPRIPSGLVPRQLNKGIGYSIEFARGDEIVWEIARAQPVTTFDPRLLEDSIGTMRVIGSASRLHVPEQLGDEVGLALRSGARAYESPLGPPPSRGKPCSVVDAQGKSHPVAPCPLTDGELSRSFSPSVCAGRSGCVEPRHRMAVVDLSRPLGVDLIVVRGCRDRCVVETSTDLRAWRLVGSTDAERAAFPVASRWPARYVRVSSPFIDDITEISAWSGRPRLPDASLLVAPNRFPTASGGASSASPGRTKPSGFGWWAVVAAALIGSVVGATAMLLARKRRLPA